MPTEQQIRDAILLLAPGFVALKIFYLFGAQRPRSQWEWTLWSVIASLPVVSAGQWLSRELAGMSAFDDAALDLPARFGLAVAAGGAAAVLWRRIGGSRWRWLQWLRRQVTDSAWDMALEDADRSARPVELVLKNDGRYRGRIKYAGREDSAAEGWIYLVHPQVKEGQRFRPARGTHGILVHRAEVTRIRVYLGPADSVKRAPGDPEAPGAHEASVIVGSVPAARAREDSPG